MCRDMYVTLHMFCMHPSQSRPTIETEHDDDEDCVTCEVKFKTDEFSQLLKVSHS